MMPLNYKKLKVDGIFLVSGQLCQALLAFGVNLVLVRYITPSEFGRFAIILAGAFLFYSIISFRVNVLITRMSSSDYKDETKSILFSAMTLETIAASAIICFWLVLTGQAGLWELILISAVGLRHWTDLNKAFFERNMPYRQLAFVETGAATGGHIVAVTLAALGFGWVVLFIRELLISLINLFGLWRVGGLTLYRTRILKKAEWKQLYKESRGVWLDGVLETNFHRLTILFAGLHGGDTAAGYFFQAQRLAVVPHQILSPIVSRILSVWFGRTENNIARIEGRNKVIFILIIPLTLAGIATYFFSDPIIPWLFGKNWSPSAELLALMGGMVIFYTLFEVLKSYCLTTKQTSTMFGGRIVQYIGLLIPVLFGFLDWFNPHLSLPIGLSIAYSSAFVFIFVTLSKKELR